MKQDNQGVAAHLCLHLSKKRTQVKNIQVMHIEKAEAGLGYLWNEPKQLIWRLGKLKNEGYTVYQDMYLRTEVSETSPTTRGNIIVYQSHNSHYTLKSNKPR